MIQPAPSRLLLSLVVPVLFTINAHAQTLLGPKAGVNLATIHYSEEDEQPNNTLIGLMGGIQLEIPLAPALRLAPEFVYVQKGERDVETSPYYKMDLRLYVNYIEIPVLVKFAIGNPDRVHCLVTAGPSVGYLLSAKWQYKATILGETEEFKETIDLSEGDISRIDLGACLGLGLALPTGFGGIRLEARYQFGLTDLDTNSDDFEVMNRGVQIGLAFLFHPDKKPAAPAPAPAPAP